MTKLLSFDAAIGQATQAGGLIRVLLGNGFSIGAHAKFAYGTLYEQARATGLPDHIIELFDRYGTTNFEEILRQLDQGQWLAEHYRLRSTDPGRDMAADYAQLREALVEAISASHPALAADVGLEKLEACYAFLSSFQDVYTTNYDLLLYWTSLTREPFRFEDGFGHEDDTDDSYCVFLPTSSSRPRLYFLHGALHLTTVEGEVCKLVWNTTGIRLIDQVRAGLEAKRYPLIVSEGTPLNKLERVESSSYLSHCLRKFEGLGGNLFTYGWAMSAQDNHLLRAIEKNTQLERLFVGVYGDPASPTNQALIRAAARLAGGRDSVLASGRPGRRTKKKRLEVNFFDASTANVWGAK